MTKWNINNIILDRGTVSGQSGRKYRVSYISQRGVHIVIYHPTYIFEAVRSCSAQKAATNLLALPITYPSHQ